MLFVTWQAHVNQCAGVFLSVFDNKRVCYGLLVFFELFPQVQIQGDVHTSLLLFLFSSDDIFQSRYLPKLSWWFLYSLGMSIEHSVINSFDVLVTKPTFWICAIMEDIRFVAACKQALVFVRQE